MANMFDGLSGALIAKVMARQNAEAEGEAIEILNPPQSANILVVGFGPGVGLSRLASRIHSGTIVGVDPSVAMMREAGRRNRRHIAEGKVSIHQTTADAIPAPSQHFDAAIAVNSLQLCDPFIDTAREIARVLRSQAQLVSLTHDWALSRHAGSVAAWLQTTGAALVDLGFDDIRSFAASAEKGRAIALIARRK